MTLRAKVLVTNAVMLTFLLIALNLGLSRIVSHGFARIEARDTEQNVQRVVDMLNADQAALDRTVRDWSAWDDTYAFIADHNPAYVESNWAEYTFRDTDLDWACYVDRTGRVVLSRYYDPTLQAEAPAPTSVLDLCAPDSPLLARDDHAEHHGGLLMTPDGPCLVSVWPIVPTSRDGPVRGTLLAGRRLDPQRLARLARMLRLSIDLRALDSPLPADFAAAHTRLAQHPGRTVTTLAGGQAAGFVIQSDVYGRPAALLRVAQPAIISPLAAATWAHFQLALLGVGLLFGAAMTVLMQRLVVGRLRHFSQNVRRISASGDLGARVPVQHHDELSDLTIAVNGLLARTQRSQRLLQARQRELQEARDAADSANRAKSAFLANMSHEIRTPLTAITGFAELLVEGSAHCAACTARLDCATRRQRREHAEMVLSNGRHLLSVVNDILDLSKIESGKLTLENLTCSPATIIAEAVSNAQVRARSKGLTFELRLATPLPERIQSDPTRLRQVLLNLLANAIKFTELGGVTLTVQLIEPPASTGRSPQLRFDIADTGIGITPEQLTRIFQPFAQADSSTSRRFGGTGLGLAISKHLAAALGGELTVTSQPGRGSTFTLTIATGALDNVPRSTASAPLDPCPSPAGPVTASQDQPLDCTVLLAEDGPDNQRLISFLLTKAGARVTVAENGQVAANLALAARAEGRSFDVVLMDMQMPVLDGYAATRRLRTAGYSGPIVALTAHAMTGDREKCLAAGCDGFATKPIDRHSLIALVRQMTQHARGAPPEAAGTRNRRTDP